MNLHNRRTGGFGDAARRNQLWNSWGNKIVAAKMNRNVQIAFQWMLLLMTTYFSLSLSYKSLEALSPLMFGGGTAVVPVSMSNALLTTNVSSSSSSSLRVLTTDEKPNPDSSSSPSSTSTGRGGVSRGKALDVLLRAKGTKSIRGENNNPNNAKKIDNNEGEKGEQQQKGEDLRHARVLLGIFTYDKRIEHRIRRFYRELFAMDPRTCSLGEFKKRHNDDLVDCELIYTFVVGASPMGRSRIVIDPTTKKAPYSVIVSSDRAVTAGKSADFVEDDMTLLNIKENYHDGKSETWLLYATQIMQKLGGDKIDYVAKMDSSTLVHLDQYFQFANQNLPPSPYNHNILAGMFADKWWWSPELGTAKEYEQKEKPFRKKFGYINHFYAKGDFYLLSSDLALTVVHAAPNANSYLEHKEDHDISSMAFAQSDQQIHMIMISLEDRFWRDTVTIENLKRNFHKAWMNELSRIENIGRQLWGDEFINMARQPYIGEENGNDDGKSQEGVSVSTERK